MTPPDMRRDKTKYLDGKFLFEYYWKTMGPARSYDGLRRYCISQGIVNTQRGTNPNRMSIMKAMWRWATRKENFEEGYEIVNNAMRDEGRFMSKDEWKEFLRDKVHVAYQYNVPKEKKFLRKNGYNL